MNPTDVLYKWLEAVNQTDLEKILSLYDESAMLIPTFSNKVLSTPDKIQDYFKKLGTREELSVALHEKTLRIQTLVENQLFTLNGIYNWRFKVDDEVLNFEARFSFIIDLSKSNPIIHHHSSQVPRTI